MPYLVSFEHRPGMFRPSPIVLPLTVLDPGAPANSEIIAHVRAHLRAHGPALPEVYEVGYSPVSRSGVVTFFDGSPQHFAGPEMRYTVTPIQVPPEGAVVVDDDPVRLLRAAAGELEVAATATQADTVGWDFSAHSYMVTTADEDAVAVAHDVQIDDGLWMRLVGPNVAAPLVDILRSAAFALERHPEVAGQYGSCLTLARAIVKTSRS